ncbi:hypothetical protein [Catellatospora citrea]|nr:hypothetical protein [Catellatospora citrea]
MADDGWSCRQLGWLLDQRTLCVGVQLWEGKVEVSLEGSRAFA